MARAKKNTSKRKQVRDLVSEHLFTLLILVVFAAFLYESVYLSRCLKDWNGPRFRVYEGQCSFYCYDDGFTRARSGWYFHMDNGMRLNIPCDVCTREDFRTAPLDASPDAPVSICYMPPTFLRYGKIIVSMKAGGEELISQSAVYAYLKDQKTGAIIVTSLLGLVAIIILPFIILSDVALYREHRRRMKRRKKGRNKASPVSKS